MATCKQVEDQYSYLLWGRLIGSKYKQSQGCIWACLLDGISLCFYTPILGRANLTGSNLTIPMGGASPRSMKLSAVLLHIFSAIALTFLCVEGAPVLVVHLVVEGKPKGQPHFMFTFFRGPKHTLPKCKSNFGTFSPISS